MSVADFPVGRSESITLDVTDDLIDRFAALSGDFNPLHMDDEAARALGFTQRVAHGALAVAFLSTLVGTKLPGPGALWSNLRLEWLKPVFPGDSVHIEGTVTAVSESARSISVRVEGTNTNQTRVLRAELVIGLGAHATISGNGATNEAPLPTNHPETAAAADRPVYVTGGSRGIGSAVSRALARIGHPIVVGYRENAAAADGVVQSIRDGGGTAVKLQHDVSVDPDSAEDLLRSISEQVGDVVAVVHGASPPLVRAPFPSTTAENFDRYWRAYVLGGAGIVQGISPAMAAHGWGRVVFLGTSALLSAPPPQLSAYVTAKMALWGLTRSLAVELGHHGATVNMVSPGLTRTDLTRETSPRSFLLEAQRNPMRRIGEPEDVAALVCFLMSDDASFINGVNLPVTGGMVMP